MTTLPLDVLRALLVLLLALPAAGAIVVALLGPRRLVAIRWVSLLVTLADLAIAVTLAIGFVEIRSDAKPRPAEGVPTFRPEIVPGASEGDRHRTTWDLVSIGSQGAVQFFVGLDGLSVWLVVLTALLMVPSVLI